jgi:hypothetical protein
VNPANFIALTESVERDYILWDDCTLHSVRGLGASDHHDGALELFRREGYDVGNWDLEDLIKKYRAKPVRVVVSGNRLMYEPSYGISRPQLSFLKDYAVERNLELTLDDSFTLDPNRKY